MNNCVEEWKKIDFYGEESKYAVSNFGNVMNLKPRQGTEPYILKPRVDKLGYLRLSLHFGNEHKNCLVHQLVARAFIPNPKYYKEINHKDGNKTNNHADNLEWCTRSQNMTHAFATGLKENKKGSESPLAKKCYEYDIKGNFIREWGSIVEAATYYGDVVSNVCAACSGKYKTFHGHIWSYKLEQINVNEHKPVTCERTYQYSKDGEFIAEYFCMDDAVEATGVDKSNITKCCLGKRKTAGGYIWSHTPLERNS